MSATDALTITSAPDAMTRYYDAKEREESAVLYINDAYLEALNSLEKLEAENVRLLKLLQRTWDAFHDATAREFVTVKNELRELGVEVNG